MASAPTQQLPIRGSAHIQQMQEPTISNGAVTNLAAGCSLPAEHTPLLLLYASHHAPVHYVVTCSLASKCHSRMPGNTVLLASLQHQLPPQRIDRAATLPQPCSARRQCSFMTTMLLLGALALLLLLASLQQQMPPRARCATTLLHSSVLSRQRLARCTGACAR